MNRTMAYFNVRDALSEPGCAVCRLKARVIDRYLDGLLREYVNDSAVRREIRRAHGFCHQHAWGLARHGAALGAAILMREVFEGLLDAVQDARGQPDANPPLRRSEHGKRAYRRIELADRLTPSARCPACVHGEEMERIYLDALANQLCGADGLLAVYEASDGLCLSHFRRAIARVQDETVCDALLNAQQRIWERLVGQLTEFIRKNDYRFCDEPLGDEGDAWLRAIAALAGHDEKGVAGRWA